MVGLVQDPPRSQLSPLPLLGLGTAVQAFPFQDSTSVWRLPSAPLIEKPTATQLVELVQDTLLRTLVLLPGLGLGMIVQVVPSQVSIRVKKPELS
jgi:hypothetical protein